MSKVERSKSKLKSWGANLIIVIVTLILMLLLGEVVVRWVDGYDLIGVELRQDKTTIQAMPGK